MSVPAATFRYLYGLGSGDAGMPDADLLERFIDRRDEAAFALLVRRHGDMVYGVCRRLLPTDQDAEDAFQAAFLVLAEKARTVNPREAVGNWLYGVARRAALLARRSIARRRERMTELTDLPAPAADPLAELRAALDDEVSRLTDVLRTVIVLCDLEGRTRKEAAAILGWPEGTVAGRLAQARRLLAKRLARHAPAVSVAAALSGTAARAPAAVLALTRPGPVSGSVAALTRAVLANMAGGKLMKTMIAVLVLACAGFGMSLGAGQDKGDGPAPNPPVNTVAAAEKPVQADPVVFWGKEVGGLQAGLSLVETKIEQAGDTTRLKVKMEVRVRNVGKAPSAITYGSPWERSPTITDAAGNEVPVRHSDFWIAPILLPVDRVIEPGKTFSLSHPEITLELDAKQPVPKNITERTIRVRQGAYTISYDWVADSHKELATGGLPFKVMEPEKDPKAAPADEVAWGKEVGGLQAGLVRKAARAYRYGDTIKLEVRIRNVGKEKVTITHGLLRACPPEVTNPRDARMTVAMPPPMDFYAPPTYRVLKPGEAITLYNPTVEVRSTDRLTPERKLRVDTPTTYVSPGKYKIAYGGMVQSHPALSTGTVGVEVTGGKPDAKDDREEDPVAWGKEVNGLQAGLVLKDARPYLQGETIKLVVRVRNVSKEAVEFRYCRETYFEEPPTVTDAKGKRIPLERDHATGFAALVPVKLAPGKEIEVGERQIELKPTLFGPGKFNLQYEQLETPENDRTLSKLATGKLELEVREAKEPQRPAAPQAKEAEEFTAWGKEVNGLQAGLSLRPGVQTAYRHGDTVTLVVRVRNVGKQPVKFSYLQPFIEHSFTVTGSDGKAVPQPEIIPDIGERDAGVVELPPGKELVLHELKRQLRPASESGNDQGKRSSGLYGTGKIGIRYERVLGSPEMGVPEWKPDPALSKLATGTLETTVTDTGKPGEPAPGPRAIVERYLAAALAGRVDEAVGLAVKGPSPQAPADRKQVSEFRKRVVAGEIRLWKVLAAWDVGEAVAVTEEFRWVEFQPAEKENPNVAAPPRVEGQPEGTRETCVSAFLVFKVVKSSDRWLVKDVDITTEKDALDRVEAFKTKHPAATAVPARAADPKAGPENKLVGTWKLVLAKYDGEAVTFPEGFTTVKHVTATQFMWASYDKDGKVIRAAGGRYSIKGDTYQETPEYGLGRDFDGIKGKAQTFKWKIVGNRWHHTGKLSNGLSVDEEWERVRGEK